MTYLAIERLQREMGRRWNWLSFRRVARLRRDANRDRSLPLLALSAHTGIEHRPDDGGRQLPSEDTVADYWRVSPGNLVFNPMWAFQGGVAVSEIEGAVSPAYRVYELYEQLHPRFVHYFLRSAPAVHQYGLLIRGITTFDRSIPRDDFEGMSIPVPPAEEQRAIADFLDRETARIDAAVASKRRLMTLLGERLQSVRGQWTRHCFDRFGRITLRRLATQIEQGWSPEAENVPAEPEEWGILKTSAVTAGFFRAEENKRLPSHLEPDPRWIVRDGDLLVTRGSGSIGNVGRATVAINEGRRLVIPDLIYRVVLARGVADFVAHILSSPQLRSLIESSIRTDSGQTLKIRGDDLANLPIPRASPEEQSELVASLETRLGSVRQAVRAVEAQIRLLAEHRQALITSAVTGQLDMDEVAS